MKKLFCLCLAVIAVLCGGSGALALSFDNGNAVSYAYTLAADASWQRVSDPYLPAGTLCKSAPIKGAEDICYRGGRLYVADALNGRIVCISLATRETRVIGEDLLQAPAGVFVSRGDEVFVADPASEKVFVFGRDGGLLREYPRPADISFGADASYKPRKLAVDSAGIITIVSEGNYDGLIQLDKNGKFLGYTGYNNVPVTLLELIEDKLFTKAQKEKLFRKIPLTFANIAQDEKGINYTLTQGVSGDALKKHSVGGGNLLGAMHDELNFCDVSVGGTGEIFAVTETGFIFEYDISGDLVFTFGGYALNSERNGLITVASGICADENFNLYVMDKERGIIQIYTQTPFAASYHAGTAQYQNGDYYESFRTFASLCAQSSGAVFYAYMGKNQLQLHNYSDAAAYFKKAGDKDGYSEAYWEVRNSQIGKVLPYAFALIVITLLASFAAKRVKRGRDKKKPPVKNRFLRDMRFGFYVLRHPVNAFYDIKLGKAGGVLSASVCYLLGALIFTVNFFFSGFLWTGINAAAKTPVLYPVLLFF
ncbi:MAG: hypothetical protein LBL15_07530, partial [Oscillospiraceae bacterium]|nr:hypothetical protein [Oscillospiraceae bacterium]